MRANRTRDRRGVSALEFAIALVPMLMLTLPVIDFTWYFLNLQQVNAAAQAATRVGAREKLADNPALVAGETAIKMIQANLPCCTEDAVVEATVIDDTMVRVEIRAPYTPLTNFVRMPTHLVGVQQMWLEDP